MQARGNEVLNQVEVDAVGNNEEQCGCRALRTKTNKQKTHKDLAVVRKGNGGRRSRRT